MRSAVLSNLLSAGYGVNRPDGRRTAPSANNRQSIGIYVATAGGAAPCTCPPKCYTLV
jgi:hypothetical protein